MPPPLWTAPLHPMFSPRPPSTAAIWRLQHDSLAPKAQKFHGGLKPRTPFGHLTRFISILRSTASFSASYFGINMGGKTVSKDLPNALRKFNSCDVHDPDPRQASTHAPLTPATDWRCFGTTESTTWGLPNRSPHIFFSVQVRKVQDLRAGAYCSHGS
jgi:hypothetical protein